MDSKILKAFPLPSYIIEALEIEGYTDSAAFRTIANPDDFIDSVKSTVRKYLIHIWGSWSK